MDIRQSEVPALVLERQPFVIDSHLVKDGCLEVVDMDSVDNRVDTVVVRLTIT